MLEMAQVDRNPLILSLFYVASFGKYVKDVCHGIVIFIWVDV